MPFKLHKIIFLSRKKICVSTIPKIFRPFTRNILIFYLALLWYDTVIGDFLLFPGDDRGWEIL